MRAPAGRAIRRAIRRGVGATTGLLLLAPIAACGSDDMDRTYSGVRGPACDTLGTPGIVAVAYPGLEQRAPRGRVVEGDRPEAVCELEATGDPTAGLPGGLSVSVTASTYGVGDPADNFDRLADYGEQLSSSGATDDVRTGSDDLGDGWWDRGTSWRTSWVEGGPTPVQLVETASASRDNLLVTVLVIERDLPEGSLGAAEERVHALVEQQVDAALDAAVLV